MSTSSDNVRPCWCGHQELQQYSDDYLVCRACGTLVSRAPFSPALYDKSYWHERQSRHHGLPEIRERARLDLPERCTHWLSHLLTLRIPPARVLEVGCGHGGYVALLNWAGYNAVGTEMSPWVAEFAAQAFGVEVLPGRVEDLPFSPGTMDVIVLNDVIEHLPDPLATLTHCARLLTPDGVFCIQTPEYREHLGFGDLQRTGDLFLKHMEGNNDEHLYLFSRRAVGILFGRLGLSQLRFSEPVYDYDMEFAASRLPLATHTASSISASLEAKPSARLVRALLDKAFESNDRKWAIRRLGGSA